jgi:hypothetical protein
MAHVVDGLIESLGPPDHADNYRRSWYQPNCSRRADLYISDDKALLVVTDIARARAASRRLRSVAPKQVVETGF